MKNFQVVVSTPIVDGFDAIRGSKVTVVQDFDQLAEAVAYLNEFDKDDLYGYGDPYSPVYYISRDAFRCFNDLWRVNSHYVDPTSTWGDNIPF